MKSLAQSVGKLLEMLCVLILAVMSCLVICLCG